MRFLCTVSYFFMYLCTGIVFILFDLHAYGLEGVCFCECEGGESGWWQWLLVGGVRAAQLVGGWLGLLGGRYAEL